MSHPTQHNSVQYLMFVPKVFYDSNIPMKTISSLKESTMFYGE